MLLAAGADVNAATSQRLTPLNIAAMHRKETILRLLIDAGASTSVPYSDRSSPLSRAVNDGATSIVLLLLSAGADINHVDRRGDSLFHVAAKCLNDDCTLLTMLLASGGRPNLNVFDRDGATPLMLALSHCNAKIARRLLDAGAAATATNPDTLSTVLHAAVSCANTEVIKMVIVAGADINAATRDGTTPIHIAARMLQADIVEHLLVLGANATPHNQLRKSPADLAEGSTRIVTALAVCSDATPTLRLSATDISKAARRLFDLRTWQVLVGLQPLGLDALCMSEIAIASLGRLGLTQPFHVIWKTSTTVKHFK